MIVAVRLRHGMHPRYTPLGPPGATKHYPTSDSAAYLTFSAAAPGTPQRRMLMLELKQYVLLLHAQSEWP